MEPPTTHRELWDNIHRRYTAVQGPRQPTDFARQVIDLIPEGGSVLDLGCGFGNDSLFFAAHGHVVVGLDFSDVAIKHNSECYAILPHLRFERHDISTPLPFPNAAFSLVYARLSLHYFSDTITRSVFREIRRVLHAGGLVAFVCKSIDDPLYGQGEQIEEDMYNLHGHIRHFFSEAYARTCLQPGFSIQQIASERGELYGQPSAYVIAIGRKINAELRPPASS
jgi:SAM-dependent methyltransferase